MAKDNFVIPGQLPGLNEIIDAAKSHWAVYGDPENWFVFQGRIKPGWIRRVERKEKPNDYCKNARGNKGGGMR